MSYKIIGIDLRNTNDCLVVWEGGEPSVIRGETDCLPDISPALLLKTRKEEEYCGRTWKPEELVALFLRRLKRKAEEYLGETVTECVISVPGYLSYIQRQAVRDAATIAGMTAVRVILEPVASALSYCGKDFNSQKLVSVVSKDGYIDLCVIDWGDDVLEVLAGRSCFVSESAGKALRALSEEAVTATGFAANDIERVLINCEKELFPEAMDALRKTFPNAGFVHMPEETMAVGTAYMCGKLNGAPGLSDFLLLDVVHETLSIETEGGVSTNILDRDTSIPTLNRQVITTSADNQTAIDIAIYEGEQELVKDNSFVGSFRLSDIELASKGEPKIEITFDMDAKGILSVYAKNQKTSYKKDYNLSYVNMLEDAIEQSRRFLETVPDSCSLFLRKPENRKPEIISDTMSDDEFEYYRRRIEQEMEDMFDAGVRSILIQFLSTLDNLERALEAALKDSQDNIYTKGILLIYNQLMKNLKDAGVTQIPSIGKAFDPAFHSAVIHVEDSSVGENIIIEELQKGYLYKGKVLRYSMVKVAN